MGTMKAQCNQARTSVRQFALSFSFWLLALVVLAQIMGCGGGGMGTKQFTVATMTPSQILTTGGQVVFTGTNFTKDVKVNFGGVAAKQVYFQSSTLIAATAAALDAASTVDVSVSSAEGGTVTLPKALTFTEPPPPPVLPTNCQGATCTYQATASTDATLSGNAKVATCSGCPLGVKAGGLGYAGNYVTFNKVSAPADGTYDLTVVGCEGGGTQNYQVVVNGGSPVSVPLTGSNWDAPAAPATITVSLKKGDNTIRFGNDNDWSPDVVYIVVSPTTYWAYDTNNTLSGTARIDTTCTGCPQGTKVGGLGYGGFVTINNVYVPSDGNYTLTVVGVEGGGTQNYKITVNAGTPISLSLSGSSWTTPAPPVTATIPLNQGDNNTIKLGNDTDWSPDVVYISVGIPSSN